jgi:hypothetical protein
MEKSVKFNSVLWDQRVCERKSYSNAFDQSVHVCMNMQVYQENLLLFPVERERGGCGGRGEGGRAIPGSDFKI